MAAAFAASLLHTWVYADFLEDPITWTLLAIGVTLALQARTPGEQAHGALGPRARDSEAPAAGAPLAARS